MSSTPSTVARAGRLPRIAAAVVALAVAAGAIVGLAEPASAANAVYTGSVPAGTTIYPGDTVTSPNGQFRLVMQGDGNLVEYGIGNAVLWASNTSNQPGAVAVIGRNRALDIMRGTTRVARWASAGKPQSTKFELRGDGTMVLWSGATAIVNWNNFQSRVPAGSTILPGTTLRADSSNDRTFSMLSNGVLQQRLSGNVVWATSTAGNTGAYAAVQADGNLVVYSAAKKALWASNTSRAGGGSLMVQVDNNVVLYGKSDTRSWSTRPVSGLLWPVASTKISGRYNDDRGAGHVPRYHQGTDAAVGTGTPVYASATGTVTSTVANNASYGNYVIVTYGMTTVLTAHLSKIEVKQGQIVSKNTEIAKSGNTGQSTGPHVHVEVRQGGTLTDPLKVLHFR